MAFPLDSSVVQQSSESLVVVGLLVAAALGSAALGALMLTAATMGVGLICGGCLLAICARLVQAGAHYRVLAQLTRESHPTPTRLAS